MDRSDQPRSDFPGAVQDDLQDAFQKDSLQNAISSSVVKRTPFPTIDANERNSPLSSAACSEATATETNPEANWSHWDRLPREIHLMILQAAGPLTQFLAGTIRSLGDKSARDSLQKPAMETTQRPQGPTSDASSTASSSRPGWPPPSVADLHGVWRDLMRLDWQGDLRTLPAVRLSPEDVVCCKSRNLFLRLRRRFPGSASVLPSAPDSAILATTISDWDAYALGAALPGPQPFLDDAQLHYGWVDLSHVAATHIKTAIAMRCVRHGCWQTLNTMLSNNIVNLPQIHRTSKRLFHCPAIDIAAAFGHIGVIVSLLNFSGSKVLISPNAIVRAAANGHLSVIRLLHSRRRFIPPSVLAPNAISAAIDAAAANGHLDIVQWIHSKRTEKCSKRAMDGAAAGGHLHVVKWLHSNRFEGCTAAAMDWAAANGHLSTVKWLHRNRTEGCTANAMDWAASNGHFGVVAFLHHNRTEGCSKQAMDDASRHGHISIVRFLHTRRTEGCTTFAIDWAASEGHLNVMQFLFYNRTEKCTWRSLVWAAEAGHLDIIRWIHTNQIVKPIFAAKALHTAMKNGHRDVALYLIEKYGVKASQPNTLISRDDSQVDLCTQPLSSSQVMLNIETSASTMMDATEPQNVSTTKTKPTSVNANEASHESITASPLTTVSTIFETDLDSAHTNAVDGNTSFSTDGTVSTDEDNAPIPYILIGTKRFTRFIEIHATNHDDSDEPENDNDNVDKMNLDDDTKNVVSILASMTSSTI